MRSGGIHLRTIWQEMLIFDTNSWYEVEIYQFLITTLSPIGKWVNGCHVICMWHNTCDVIAIVEWLESWYLMPIWHQNISFCQHHICNYHDDVACLCVVTQKWPFLDVFAIHDNVSFSCHKDIVKLNGMTVSVDEYEKEWERRRMGNEWMKSKIKSLNEWSEWGTNDCKIP